MSLRRGIPGVLCAIGLCFTLPARADGPGEPAQSQAGASAAVLAGYGHEFVQGLQGLDLGFGASGGYTFTSGASFGATLLTHLGASERARTTRYRYENQRNEYALSLDAGYDFLIARRWVIRPLLSFGFFVDNARTKVGAATISSHDEYGFMGPGLIAFVRFDRFNIGIDWRIPIFPSSLIGRLMTLGYLRIGAEF